MIESVAGCFSWKATITTGGTAFSHVLLLVLAIRADENSRLFRLPVGHAGPM